MKNIFKPSKVYQLSKLHFFKFVLVLHEHLDENSFKICYCGKFSFFK